MSFSLHSICRKQKEEDFFIWKQGCTVDTLRLLKWLFLPLNIRGYFNNLSVSTVQPCFTQIVEMVIPAFEYKRVFLNQERTESTCAVLKFVGTNY